MKKIILLSMLVATSGVVHAELIVAKGAKATLQRIPSTSCSTIRSTN